MQAIPLSEVITRDVELIEPVTSVHEVVHRMRMHRHSCALVGRHGVPLGIITERDLVKLLVRRDPGLALWRDRDLGLPAVSTYSVNRSYRTE